VRLDACTIQEVPRPRLARLLNFTVLPQPPLPAKRRAARKPIIFGLIRSWVSDGPDTWEQDMLSAEGQRRWLDRGRVTDGMLVLLLLDKLATLRYPAAERPPDATYDRARTIEILMRWQATQPPEGVDRGDVKQLLTALRRHDWREAERSRRRFRDEKQRKREHARAAAREDALRRRYGEILSRARNAVTAERTTTNRLILDTETGGVGAVGRAGATRGRSGKTGSRTRNPLPRPRRIAILPRRSRAEVEATRALRTVRVVARFTEFGDFATHN
jgi:hypothetical protein